MRELHREFAAAKLRMRDESTRDIVQAYTAVRIYVQTQNDRRMPDLKTLLPDYEPARIQSYEEQKAAIEMLSRMYGGKIVQRQRSA